MLKNIKITTWADLLYIVTLLYITFLLVGFFYTFDAKVIFFNEKELNGQLNLITYWQLKNPSLEKWKMYIMLFGLLIVCVIIDKILLIPFFYRFTKAGKVAKMEVRKKYHELKNDQWKEKW